jgi:ribose transport system ATP-binding protein
MKLNDERFALTMSGIVKTFGGTRALDGANLKVTQGTIHGLVGQNGAGKSTLIKILAGLHAPDSGKIEIAGQLHRHLTPHRVEKLGIHFIHQERLLAPSFTVGEALFLGCEPCVGPLPLLNRRQMKQRAVAIMADYFGAHLPVGALIAELTPAQRQIVQIARALIRNPSLLVFDEPTAALVKHEADRLFETIQRLRGKGLTIIYISHYLYEIELLCDSVTVLRNGVDVGVVNPKEVPATALISMMVARNIEEMFPKKKVEIGAPLLTVHRLRYRNAFSEVSLTVHCGEILGLTGLLGSGAKELVRCLFGLLRAESGEIKIEGKTVRLPSPFAAVKHRLGLVPEDRAGHGVALDMSVRENVTLASLGQYSRRGFLDARREKKDVDILISKLSVQTPSRDTAVRYLSGGNQQKVSLGKWLNRHASLYILDEPTVGIDVGAKVEIYRLIEELTEQGAGILILSADLLELLGICDRVLVMFRGNVVHESYPGQTNSNELLRWATGAGKISPKRAWVDTFASVREHATGESIAERSRRPQRGDLGLADGTL